jgi:hypothetical protein
VPSLAQQLISDCLVAQGEDRAKADRTAAFVMQVLPAAGIVRQSDLEAFELDAKIYKLRGSRLTAMVISERVGRGRTYIFDAIRRHAKARRAVLKLIA